VDFFGFAMALSRMRDEMKQRVTDLEVEYRDRSAYARALAMGPAISSLADMEGRYGENLDANSHSCLGGSISSTSQRRRSRL
jgi:hypothetical protein